MCVCVYREKLDHHCLWLNNCIGYSNYRTFLLTLFYLVLGCWYGVSILMIPYYQSIKIHIIQQHPKEQFFLGLKQFFVDRNFQALKGYSNIESLLDIPTPMTIYNELRYGTIQPEMVLKIIFPFLVGVGILLTMFFKSHCTYVLKTNTTLEHMGTKSFLTNQAILKSGGVSSIRAPTALENDTIRICNMKVVNPFHQGAWENVRSVLGSCLLYIFLPIRVDIPPPYLPDYKDKCD